MKFKLDENFGSRTLGLFQARGHDAVTGRQERLGGTPDRLLFDVCAREARCLVTLDHDFAAVVRFPPRTSPGIAVIRVSKNLASIFSFG
ncbi:MAG: DUF5615 family PIN-like protein [Bryobacteraceae bacterium]